MCIATPLGVARFILPPTRRTLVQRVQDEHVGAFDLGEIAERLGAGPRWFDGICGVQFVQPRRFALITQRAQTRPDWAQTRLGGDLRGEIDLHSASPDNASRASRRIATLSASGSLKCFLQRSTAPHFAFILARLQTSQKYCDCTNARSFTTRRRPRRLMAPATPPHTPGGAGRGESPQANGGAGD